MFGRGQVSSYLIAGLGDAPESLVAMAERLLALGVYPFLVPFVPHRGHAFADARPRARPSCTGLYEAVGALIRAARRCSPRDMKAGCGKCGACSALSAYEVARMIDADGFTCRLARGEAERAAYFELRRQIFCDEQGLFAGDDRDAVDDHAFADRLPGRGRRRWWGWCASGRRARTCGGADGWACAPTCARWRRWADRWCSTAVGTARAWGARQFRATVQRPNVAFFRRLHWRSLEEMDLLGQPHHLMEAELERYPLVHEVRPGRLDRGCLSWPADLTAALGVQHKRDIQAAARHLPPVSPRTLGRGAGSPGRRLRRHSRRRRLPAAGRRGDVAGAGRQ